MDLLELLRSQAKRYRCPVFGKSMADYGITELGLGVGVPGMMRTVGGGGGLSSGVGDSEGLGEGEGVGLGDGVVVGHPLAAASDPPLAQVCPGESWNWTGGYFESRRPLMNGTAMCIPGPVVPKTPSMPSSPGWLLSVCPAQLATTNCGVYVMYQASTKLSVVPDLPAVWRLKRRPQRFA